MLSGYWSSSRCVIRALITVRAPYSSFIRMVLERRSLRFGSRTRPQSSTVSEEKQFYTPLKPSNLTKAELNRASAVFSDVEADEYLSTSESSESSRDCASQGFARRRESPQLDTIKRKLNFNHSTLSSRKRRIVKDLEFHSVSATFRARKIRAAEQMTNPVNKMVKSKPVDQVDKFDHLEVESGAEISSQPGTKSGERQRTNLRGESRRIKSESPDFPVKQEMRVETKDLQAPRLQRRRTCVKIDLNSEHEEITRLVKEEPKAKMGFRRRKLDLDVGVSDTGKESKKHKKQSEDLDQCSLKGSTALVLVDATNVKPPSTGADLAVDLTSGGISLPYKGPYPCHGRPYPEECEAVRDLLSDLHGHLPEYEHHKVSCPTIELRNQGAGEVRGTNDDDGTTEISSPELAAVVMEKVESEVAAPTGNPRERRTVLDSLVGTLLSQNTTEKNSRKAFASLKMKYPTWEDVYRADPQDVVEAIRCGGLAEIKSARILDILKTIAQERGEICMEYLRSMSNEEIKSDLSRFKGVGPKTVACVLMFHLQRKEFPVDTHVFRISKALGWVPAAADREKAYLHLNQRIPDHLKFDIHCLFVTHGRRCPHCAKRQTLKAKDVDCPLTNWSSRVLKSSSKRPVLLLKGSKAS